ncbi:hypothetical protein ABB10_25460 [Bacillus thuringiensis]|nr:hypothetical protein [Bacillus thuringiensis]MBH0355415.1 hypothetical protein [Bacillus thuringiensis]
MVQRFLLIHERSIKEWTRAADFSSSWQFSKTTRFGDANRRGSPSRIEGLGSWIKGVWGKIPQWVWATPKVLGHARHGKAKPISVADPYVFDAVASIYV